MILESKNFDFKIMLSHKFLSDFLEDLGLLEVIRYPTKML